MEDVQLIGEIKRGETFSILINLKLTDGNPANLDLIENQVSSTIRRENGVVLAQATVTKTDVLGQYRVRYNGSTGSWPLGQVRTDIRAVVGGDVIKSKPTAAVSIIRDETREPVTP